MSEAWHNGDKEDYDIDLTDVMYGGQRFEDKTFIDFGPLPPPPHPPIPLDIKDFFICGGYCNYCKDKEKCQKEDL